MTTPSKIKQLLEATKHLLMASHGPVDGPTNYEETRLRLLKEIESVIESKMDERFVVEIRRQDEKGWRDFFCYFCLTDAVDTAKDWPVNKLNEVRAIRRTIVEELL